MAPLTTNIVRMMERLATVGAMASTATWLLVLLLASGGGSRLGVQISAAMLVLSLIALIDRTRRLMWCGAASALVAAFLLIADAAYEPDHRIRLNWTRPFGEIGSAINHHTGDHMSLMLGVVLAAFAVTFTLQHTRIARSGRDRG